MKKKVIIHYPLLIFFIINVFSFLLLFYFYSNDFASFVVFKTILFIGLLWIPYLISKIIKTEIPKIIYKLYFAIILIDLLAGKILMFERFTVIYNYIVLFSQGIIFYIFGLWFIKFLDDYGFLSYKIIAFFSSLFAISLSVLKEIVFYFIRGMFKLEMIDYIGNVVISIVGIIFILVLSIIDNKYYQNKYYLIIDRELERKT